MSEWWTYTLSDFLMFSPRVYLRLIERYNEKIWPLQIVFTVCTLAVLPFAMKRSRFGAVAGFLLLAAAWILSGWQFLWERYATINWAVSYFAAAFMVQAALLVLFALREAGTDASPPTSRMASYGGAAIALSGLLVFPSLTLIHGRPIATAESFGAMPDPTAITTFGLLLVSWRRSFWLLLPIPILWCLFSTLTLWSLEEPGATLPLAAAIITAALLLLRSGERRAAL
ncbi:MAG: DUF6064 family protein [Shinella sp.]|nr:DUF6064 family protein [Shinella sp.]